MEQRGNVKKWISLVLFILLASLVVYRVYDVLSWKDTRGAYVVTTEQFYRTDKDLIDAAFFGSSHGYAAVDPTVLWEEYGYSLFNFSTSGQDKYSAVHYIRELLKTQHPEVIFVDLYATEFEWHGVIGNVYRNMLSMKLSRNSIDLVTRCIEEDKRLDYYLRWPIVHTRYRELGMYDFYENPYNTYSRGEGLNFAAEDAFLQYGHADATAVLEIEDSNREFVDNLAAIRDEYGVDIVTVMLPFQISEEEQTRLNGVKEYLAEKDITCIDFNQMYDELDISGKTDFADSGHMNTNGARKITQYLGSYLREHYSLADHRGDAAYWQWEKAVVYARHRMLQNRLKEIDDAQSYAGALTQMEEDLVILMVIPDAFQEDERHLKRAAAMLGLPDAYADGNAVCIIRGGSATECVPADEENAIYYDADALHTVWAEGRPEQVRVRSEDGVDWEETEMIGWLLGMGSGGLLAVDDTDGMSVLVYDRFLGEVIDSRTLY